MCKRQQRVDPHKVHAHQQHEPQAVPPATALALEKKGQERCNVDPQQPGALNTAEHDQGAQNQQCGPQDQQLGRGNVRRVATEPGGRQQKKHHGKQLAQAQRQHALGEDIEH